LLDLTDRVWAACCGDLDAPGRSGPKPKLAFRGQLRAVLLDLYVAWLHDPALCLGVSMSKNHWKTRSRYNRQHLSRWITELVPRLEKAGLIDVEKGSYSGPGAPGNRTTRIRASWLLQKMFRALRTTRDDVVQVPRECIILREGEGDDSRTIEYEDTPETHRMRGDLDAYNTLIAGSFIDIPVLDDPWLLRPDGRGGQVKVAIDRHHQSSHRIFSRGRWDLNGRFYGPWWQLISGDDRRMIFINDTPTVEIDFKGLHLAILSAEAGIELQGDPYELPEGTIPGVSAKQQRKAIKTLILVALNAATRKATFAGFRDRWATGSLFKSMRNEDLERLLEVFVTRYSHLRDSLGSDQGIRLMNIDSRIAEKVLNHFTGQGVPVLCVHDSFIIDYTRSKELQQVMISAAGEVVGRELKVEGKGVGWDEALDWRDYVVLDFRIWSETPRSEGYLARLADWEARNNRTVVPYRK